MRQEIDPKVVNYFLNASVHFMRYLNALSEIKKKRENARNYAASDQLSTMKQPHAFWIFFFNKNHGDRS